MALVPLVGSSGTAEREAVSPSPAVPTVALVSAPAVVLVVDSDPSTYGEVVAAAGEAVRVIGVPDAYQALAFVRAENVDVVVLELFLPGADGLEVLRRLRALADPPRVVVVTHARSSLPAAGSLGADAVLAKPVTREALADALRTALAPEGPRVVVQHATSARPVACVVL